MGVAAVRVAVAACVAVALLLAGLTVGIPEEEPAALVVALTSDDHCSARSGAGADGTCALNALQRRVALGEEAASTRRRRHRHKSQFGSTDLSREAQDDFRQLAQAALADARNLSKAIDMLEGMVNETYRIVTRLPAAPAPMEAAGMAQAAADLGGAAGDSGSALAAVPSRRRRRGMPPRAGTVQDWLDNLQRLLDGLWRRETWCSRLDGLSRGRLAGKKVPAEGDEAGGNTRGAAGLLQDSPAKTHLQGTLDEIRKEVTELSAMVVQVQQSADETRRMASDALRKQLA